LKKEQFLFRFLATGVCTLLLSGAAFAAAGAAENSLPAVTVATAPADTASAQTANSRTASVEVAAPTAGADLAMWGVEPAAETEGRTAESGLVRRFADGIVHRSAALAANLTRNAMRFLGVRYVFGGTSTAGFDCSGYVQHVFAMLGKHLPRTADAQYYAGHKVGSAKVAPGDLVFFQTYASGPSHVGIYLGNDRFVHASSSRGVTVSSLHDHYWSARYLGAKRYI
jgi:cell wall-associated NlpC family hydrolase